jgi:asparagine N-glycosylation enzyme membrane subunit Stt3
MYESDATALDWNSGYQRGYYRSESIEERLRGLANGFWFAALALAGVGLLAARSRMTGTAIALPLLVVLWTAMHLLFFGDSRFHYPIVFVVAILGARGVVAILDAVRRPLAVGDRGYAST